MSEVLILRKNSAHDSLFMTCEMFMSAKRSEGISPHTERSYRNHLFKYADWLHEQSIDDVQRITVANVRFYFQHLLDEYGDGWTAHDHARLVRTFMRWLYTEELVTADIMRRVKLPKLPKKILPPLTEGDVKKLLDACMNDRDKAMIAFMVDSGVRCAELGSLKMRDFDMKTGSIFVREGKGSRDRITYIGNKTKKLLLKYLLSRGKLEDDAPLFASLRNGTTPLAIISIYSAISDVGKRAGVEVSPHQLRRTFAVLATKNQIGAFELQRLMGHASISTTQVYVNLANDDIARAHREHGPMDHMKQV